MNNLQIFSNEEFGQVRTVTRDNEVWFVGKDIAECLGYKDTDQALRVHVDTVDKLTRKIDGSGQNRNMTVINESGLYGLILSSKLPNAKKFKHWVTSDVLPAIRKTGGYIVADETMTDAEIMAKALLVAQATIQKKNELLKTKEVELTQTKENLNNKNKFINQIAISENSLLVREVAKIASKEKIIIGEKRLWDKLRQWGLIFKNSTEPKQLAVERGLFEVVEGSKTSKDKTFTYHTTRVTGKGQTYIISKLLEEQRLQ